MSINPVNLPENSMDEAFCPQCCQTLLPGAKFCDLCGHPLEVVDANKAATIPTQAELPTPTPTAAPAPPPAGDANSSFGTLGRFFASHANLSLVTLLVFSGLLIATLPVGWAYAQMQWQNRSGTSATSDSRSVGDAATAMARCSPILVYFDENATVTDVASLLASLDASIAFGPNENGAFEVAVSPRSGVGPDRVMDALNKASSLVVTASLRQRCVR